MYKKDLIYEVMKYWGLEEIPGDQHNPQILEFFKTIGATWFTADEIPWCSALMCHVAESLCLEHPKSARARDWEKVGTEVFSIAEADVAIFKRGTLASGKGHVGIPLGESSNKIWTLGGNQGNKIKISPYKKGDLIKLITLNEA